MLGGDGPFADLIDGFAPRREQQEMAAAVARAIEDQEVLVCEAGTGTGKTLAYLVPALLAGRKTVLSTATRTLQDQLFHRDLPLAAKALNQVCNVALLKGRQNYVCLYRLERAHGDPTLVPARYALLEHLTEWASRSSSGDLEEVSELDEEPHLRAAVTSTIDNCLGQECPRYQDCFVSKARREAANADIVVVNHYLLFADMVLRESGFAEILPTADALILDEAHQLPAIASMFFSRSLSSQQVATLCRDSAKSAADEAPDMPSLTAAVRGIEQALNALRAALGQARMRRDWAAVASDSDAPLTAVREGVAALCANLHEAQQRGPALARCAERADDLRATLALFGAGEDDEHVRWLETSERGFTLHETPVSVAEQFAQKVLASEAAWIFTSATLAVEDRFDHFARMLGLDDRREALWQSPFDYQSQSLLYLPDVGCEPRDPAFAQAFVDATVPVLELSRGRAFVLFTSHRLLELCADLLRDRITFPLLTQGEAPRSELLRRFQTRDNAVLLGTATFWEGIDVRGERLSCVIIDKLPFAVPEDPVIRARIRALTVRGEDAFTSFQLPEAITALKQGAGRLIRDSSDRGVLVIGDIRLKRRGYGRAFINSLPPMPVSEAIEDVRAFFSNAGGP